MANEIATHAHSPFRPGTPNMLSFTHQGYSACVTRFALVSRCIASNIDDFAALDSRRLSHTGVMRRLPREVRCTSDNGSRATRCPADR
jgi:hypothetical protein